MPALTLNSENNPSSSPPQSSISAHSRSRSSSPIQPPYSPITPVLAPARFPPNSNHQQPILSSNPRTSTNTAAAQQPQQPPRTYTHPTQQPATFIPFPQAPPEVISLDSNPDAIAVRSAISILQLQRQKAISDLQALERIKERALADPEAFAAAVAGGEVKTKDDGMFSGTSLLTAEEEEEEEEEEAEDVDSDDEKADEAEEAEGNGRRNKKWPDIPAPQNVVRTPPINWNQYGLVGESLDRLHADQVARPVDGLPAKIVGGQVVPVEGGPRRTEPMVLVSPYNPLKDRIDKGGGTKKGGASKR